MTTFDIKDDFYLNNKPFKIISGSIHYFRVVPEYWRDRLEKLRNMGCNTVETYVPWNLHEPHEAQYDFSDGLDLVRFLKIAQEVGLYVILRPSPYICAEWEFGGFPYWLLRDPKMKLRVTYPNFMTKIERYLKRLIAEIADEQITRGGNIILMQVENEYGGYANDHDYLRSLAKIMRESGAEVPFVTSDGPWGDMLENGSIPELALPTMNCGSKIADWYKRLADFHGEKRPLMVMEFWIGWFDAWGDAYHHTTSSETAATELRAALTGGSVNIYMFHGGTNFGFTNGANYYEKLAPDVTSYDYDALLTEWGDMTPKYLDFQKVISEFTEIPQIPLSTQISKKAYGSFKLTNKVSLFNTLATLAEPITSVTTQTMEELGQGFGYIYYQTTIGKARPITDFRLVTAMDRATIFVNQTWLATQYDQEIGEKLEFDLTEPDNQLGVLVENMGRVNYSVKMTHQFKGIKDGVVINGAFHTGWQHYALPMNNLEKVNFSADWQENVPAFYEFDLEIAETADTFIDLTGWGKGFVTVNGFNIGRFWETGPQKRLYIPAPKLQKGINKIIIFETEGQYQNKIILTEKPNLGEVKCLNVEQ
ncbi:glycosyl hydrolase [Lactococcus hodotermopsidis]|uniref:Glycosyl hydrolase n=1 Tax=Pseudolactococcus hodotermopsidis TaxID=2709157 RepID=A0A6A0BD19_9LACT|nr:beta-galactosidase family protein [Lactococcus hodotermopsidis]GFH42726.1 glycosyl hydrolase [Lactococcus hodotermopsidis]